jgi:hypothetical protein
MTPTQRSQAGTLTIEEFFRGYETSRPIFAAIQAALDAIQPCELRVTKSQIAFRRRKAFAWVWIPEKYLRGKIAPLVLSLSLPERDHSPRWKEIVEPYPARYMHHLELFSAQDVDDEVRAWIWKAWSNAG